MHCNEHMDSQTQGRDPDLGRQALLIYREPPE
jgi:hypothetical protein